MTGSRVPLIVVALILCTGAVSGQTTTNDSKGPPPKYDPASVERGKTTFVGACGFCHGSSAKGGEKGPDLLRSVLVLDDENGKTIGPVILRGRPDKGMPRFPFTPQQIADIANFLHNSIKNAIDRDNYKILNIVTGDPKAGAAYFNSTGHCGSCHSVTGDLKGIGAKYEPVTLQDKILQPNYSWTEGTPPHPVIAFSVTVTLPSGESFTGTPVHYDDFNVALREPTQVKIKSFVPGILLVLGTAPAFAQMLDPALLTKPATDAWPTYHGDYSGRRFSTLTKINQSNVKHLTLAWIFRIKVGITPNAIVGG